VLALDSFMLPQVNYNSIQVIGLNVCNTFTGSANCVIVFELSEQNVLTYQSVLTGFSIPKDVILGQGSVINIALLLANFFT
jgi:hypothetical protein